MTATLHQRARDLSPPAYAPVARLAAPAAAAIAVTLLLHVVVQPAGGPFTAKILLDIGVNIILAVSLTMVNGFTGQFSMGHAGFMALGGYTAGAITYYGSIKLWGAGAASATKVGGALSQAVIATEIPGLRAVGLAMLIGAALVAGGLMARFYARARGPQLAGLAVAAAGLLLAAAPLLMRIGPIGGAAGSALRVLGERPPVGKGDLLFLGACVGGGLVAAAAGLLVGLPSLRLRGDYLAIVTLGFGEIVRVFLQASGGQVKTASKIQETPFPELMTRLGGALGFTGVPFYSTIFWVWLWVAVMLLVAYRLKGSTFGRAFISIREDEVAAEAMGIRTTRYKVSAFVLSAFFAGVAGALYAHLLGSINAGELGFQKSFEVIIMVVLGGLGSISGAVLAAVILTILPEALRAVAEYRMIVYALMLILTMILRPQGLFGIHELWEIWRGRAPAGPRRAAAIGDSAAREGNP